LAIAKEESLLVPQVVWGHYAAASEGNDLILYRDDTRTTEITRFTFPRQRVSPFLCIADFFRSVESADLDYASFMLVTMGARVSERCQELFADNHYTDYLMLHGLGVEMAEALAEMWHKRIRGELGFVEDDGPTLTGLFRQQYRGGATRGAIPPVPISPTTPKSPNYSRASALASRSPKASSCTPNRRPTRSSAITRWPSTSSRNETRAARTARRLLRAG